jgi:hypothetical protein
VNALAFALKITRASSRKRSLIGADSALPPADHPDLRPANVPQPIPIGRA